jgi:hypothetical protein
MVELQVVAETFLAEVFVNKHMGPGKVQYLGNKVVVEGNAHAEAVVELPYLANRVEPQ